ncbi:MAG TPA: 3'-5' exonuclease, partial [Acidimicrobiales bacterium]|nr:3'-5' exonuclease [Acidimicrobiales bacterium]
GPLAACLPDVEALAADAWAQANDAAARAGDVSGDRAADPSGDSAAEAAAATDVALVVRLAHDHLRLDPGASAIGFVSWLIATLQSEGADEHRDAVTIATFHAAKGLEWPIVHLAGLEEGLVPITYARNRAQRGEEARLLYVAMTRAEDELRCTWAASRTFGGKPVERRLTPWLDGLATRQRVRPPAPTGPPADWQTRLAEQRALLAEAVQPLSPTLTALHTWREEQARAARVEPAALIDDRLLEIIAERRPESHDELVSIPGMGPLLAARVGDDLLAALHGPDDST